VISRTSIALVAALTFFSWAENAFSQVRVKGYTRKDGTYVAPHVRSRPDGNSSNNWSTQGNSNPYTGTPGTKQPNPSYPVAPYSGATSSAAPATSPATAGLGAVSAATEPSPAPSAAMPNPFASNPQKTAELEPPTELSKRRGWQIRFTPPVGSTLDELRLLHPHGIACTPSAISSTCRPVTSGAPIAGRELVAERAAFFGAVNRVSQKLEVWGYTALSDCQRDQEFIHKYLQDDYSPPAGCTVLSAADLGVASDVGESRPATPPARRVAGFEKTSPAAEQDDVISAKLAARQDKHLRVCGVIQKFGKRIDGLTTYEAAQMIAESIPGFGADDFTQIAVKYGVVSCFDPHTKHYDHCTLGTILKSRRGRCR
jgi:hypothetical protein